MKEDQLADEKITLIVVIGFIFILYTESQALLKIFENEFRELFTDSFG